ncbi:MAG: undecaprenyl/decaprenyl-phosphate alpha-N-acetylglucosaminyl 1-phosphate transferase [Treponema sp.]|nr:undecaprenyl/decaprenyl-phosphate alpha-N-acetylglucosaminyl 1-phosphate transferase [Treponema sp.]
MILSICALSAGALLLSAVSMPLIIKFCKAFSLYDSVNARKIHSGNIPRLGGIGIFLAFFICVILGFFFDSNFSLSNALPLLISGILIFVFGVIDDIVEMRAIFKLAVQLVACGIVVMNDFRFRQIFGWTMPYPFSLMLTFGWILGIINAYNLIDGMDGLCGTLSLTALLTMGFILRHTFIEGAAVCFILSAAIVGFLIFNWPAPNAKIFMGDGGSQCLGFLIAVIPLYSIEGQLEFNKLLMMLVIVSFPMMDTIAAIWRRIRDHKPIMSPDKSHLHHKLLNLGFTKVQALFMVIGIQALICMTVVLSTFLDKEKAAILLGVAYVFMIGFFSVIHYTNRAVLKKIRSNTEFIPEEQAIKTEWELNGGSSKKNKDKNSDDKSREEPSASDSE